MADTRLALLVIALLVGLANAMQVFEVQTGDSLSQNDVERLLSGENSKPSPEDVAKYVSMVRYRKTRLPAPGSFYGNLAAMNNFELGDCREFELKKRAKNCEKLSGVFKEYCEQCVSHIKSYCAERPYVLLKASRSLGRWFTNPIKEYEARLEKFIKKNKMHSEPLELVVKRFYLSLNDTDQDIFKQVCKRYVDNFGKTVAYFEESREKTLKLLAEHRFARQDGYQRGLAEAVEDCKVVAAMDLTDVEQFAD
jgi:hypothetical protein